MKDSALALRRAFHPLRGLACPRSENSSPALLQDQRPGTRRRHSTELTTPSLSRSLDIKTVLLGAILSEAGCPTDLYTRLSISPSWKHDRQLQPERRFPLFTRKVERRVLQGAILSALPNYPPHSLRPVASCSHARPPGRNTRNGSSQKTPAWFGAVAVRQKTTGWRQRPQTGCIMINWHGSESWPRHAARSPTECGRERDHPS
jgi:hypothetical protein